MSEESGKLLGEEESKQTKKKKGCLYNGCLISVLLFLFLIISPFLNFSGKSSEEWKALTDAREKILPEYGKYILQFKEETGEYPKRIEDLMPKYFTELPDEINRSINNDISYDLMNCDYAPGCTPFFAYFYCSAPIDCLVRYYVIDNEFSYQQ